MYIVAVRRLTTSGAEGGGTNVGFLTCTWYVLRRIGSLCHMPWGWEIISNWEQVIDWGRRGKVDTF